MSVKLDLDVNQFPSLTWNFLKINSTHIDSSIEKDAGFTAIVSNDAIKLVEVPFKSLSDEIKNVTTGMGKAFDAEFDSFASKGKTVLIEVPECKGCASCQKVKIELLHHDGEYKAKDFVIHVNEGAEALVLFTFKGAELNEGLLGARVRLIAEAGSSVKLATVNLLGKKAMHFISAGSLVKDNALVDVTELELGASKIYSGNYQNLAGYKASCTGHAAYVVEDGGEADFNYIASHSGRETVSFMAMDGVCGAGVKKTWRGTIDFKKGCVDAKGDEQEDVLLLSPDVVNKTLPVILCDEEAVEGRHGATIGRMDRDILFYMQSRGVDEEEARRLMVSAKIHSVCRYISDDEVNAEVDAFLEKEFGE
ncbi:SufD family Fe-S cluster assembly protein [Treponema sp.]|uniref:SufB/SufD family protein n=1 Tax=Treponema sp. TaxID=166 RepID=UPI0025D67FBC|nr:SufD family Fe-S cluster assembly protein [Treponema sp.]MCR5218089.1 SufD family Fe-S cluster assembly protein [Treponema sp.]